MKFAGEFLLMIFLAVFFLLGGCTSKYVATSVCDTDQASTLCEAAEKLREAGLDVSLDDISKTLKLGNVGGLAGEAYTAREAVDFIDELEARLDDAEQKGLTYAVFKAAAEEEYKKLSPEVQVVLILVESDFDLTIPELAEVNLTDYDFSMLRKHLTKQRALIAPFLLAD